MTSKRAVYVVLVLAGSVETVMVKLQILYSSIL